MSNRKAGSLGVCCALLVMLTCAASTTTPATSASPGALELSVAAYNVAPSAGARTVTVNRVGGSSGIAVASYGTFDGSAVARTDYTAAFGTLTWADGDSTPRTFTVPIAPGGAGGGSFTVALLSASDAAFGALIEATVTIGADSAAGIMVSGNRFIDTAIGSPVALAGANLDGLDGSGGYDGAGQIAQWNIIAGITTAQWAAIAAKWGINMIRLPLNSDYWLNPTVYDDPTEPSGGLCCYTSIGPNEYTPDVSGSYQSVVATIVSNITAAGIVVSLDLHCDAPKNSSGQYIACIGETSFPSSDTALMFWTQVANAFKSNPLVVFELFTEPYGGANYNTPSPSAVIGSGNTASPGS